MKKRIDPSVVVFGAGITPDDVEYYTEKAIRGTELFIGEKILHKSHKKALRDAELFKNMRFAEKKILHHIPHSGLRRTIMFGQEFRSKPVLDVPYKVLKARINRIAQRGYQIR